MPDRQQAAVDCQLVIDVDCQLVIDVARLQRLRTVHGRDVGAWNPSEGGHHLRARAGLPVDIAAAPAPGATVQGLGRISQRADAVEAARP